MFLRIQVQPGVFVTHEMGFTRLYVQNIYRLWFE